ncbi:hypothetical protein C6A85_21280, partial [Mycobacterium sp. ITM-2017-0098]
TDEPGSPEPAAVWTLAGSTRRETAPDTPSPTAETVAATGDNAGPAVASPLGTEQQLAAERLATATVKTWPVQLMQRVLELGWLAT